MPKGRRLFGLWEKETERGTHLNARVNQSVLDSLQEMLDIGGGGWLRVYKNDTKKNDRSPDWTVVFYPDKEDPAF